MSRLGPLLLAVLSMAAGAVEAACPADRVCAEDFLRRNDPPGDRLPFRIYVPPACQGHAACPLLLFLHGLGETGTDNQSQLGNAANGAMQLVYPARQAIQPMIMVAPQCCRGEGGQWGGQKNRLVEVLEQVRSEFPYDVDRIYLTGLSMGGGGALDLIGSYNGLFAAIVPVCPHTGYTAGDAAWATTPAWFFHAVDDGTATVVNSRNHVAALRAAGGDPLYTEFATGNHVIWTRSYASRRLFDWLIAQRRALPALPVEPYVRLAEPTTGPVWTTDAATLDLAGSAGSVAAAIDSVRWFLGAASGAAAGTTSWSAAGLALGSGSQTLRVQARGASDDPDLGGWTETSASLRVLRPTVGNAAPRVFVLAEPVLHAGQRLDLRARVLDDGLPVPGTVTLNWTIEQAPAGSALEIDPTDRRRAAIRAAAAGRYRIRVTADDGAATGSVIQEALVLPAGRPLPVALAINAGGGAYDAVDGSRFEADAHFYGSTEASTASGPGAIFGSVDDPLHHDYRISYGTWGYRLPLAPGDYFVELYFAETYNPCNSASCRVQDVRLQGVPVLDRLSVFALAGQRSAVRYGFFTQAAAGGIEIELARNGGQGERSRLDAIRVWRLDGLDEALFSDGFDP